MAVRTENLCILFTDIAGYTEASTFISREQKEQLLRAHNDLLLPVVRTFKGKHVKSIGDALLLTFRSPTDAMLCAMAMQDTLHGYNITKSNTAEHIHIRIAASLGEVRVTKNDIFGDPVNLTSRIEGITPVDEIYLSEAVYLAMNKAEVPAKEVGLKELKGIPTPVRVFQIPRFTSNRVVPEASTPEKENEGVQYPFGGAHLLAKRGEGISGFVPDFPMKSPMSQAAAGTALFVGVAWGVYLLLAFRLGESEKENLSLKNNTPAVIVSSASSFSLSAQPSQQQMTNMLSGMIRRYTGDGATSSTSSSAVATPVNVAVPTVASKPPPPPKPTPAQIRTFSGAELAYRSGRINKASYELIVDKLDAELDAKLLKLKADYRAGLISKPVYEQRVRATKHSYE